MRKLILPIALVSASFAFALDVEFHGDVNFDYGSYFDSSFSPTNAANQDIDLSAKAKLDETATLRRVLARLAGRRLARTNMRFLAECTTCTHSSALFLFFQKTGGEKGDRTLDLRLMSPALYQLSYLAFEVCKISYPTFKVNR